MKIPPGKKRKSSANTRDNYVLVEGDEDEEVNTAHIKQVFPFKKPEKHFVDAVQRGAQLSVPVETTQGKKRMKLDAHLWKDSSMVGIFNIAYVGKSDGKSKRWIGNKYISYTLYRPTTLLL